MINPAAARAPRATLEFGADDIVFVCEGIDDCAVVDKLTEHWPRHPKIGTRDPQVKHTWEDEIGQLAKQVRMRRIAGIGFVCDAENSRKEALKRLQDWYEAGALAMPPGESQTLESDVDGRRLVTAYLVNPVRARSGMLEDLFLPQIQQKPIWSCLEPLKQCYESVAPPKKAMSKVIVRTFLAHENAYNTGLHLALRDGSLTVDGQEFNDFRRFVELFRSGA
jgi:hypothetical protein